MGKNKKFLKGLQEHMNCPDTEYSLRRTMKECGDQIIPDEERKMNTIRALERAAAQKEIRYCPSIARRILIQLLWLPKEVLAAQLLFMLALPCAELLLPRSLKQGEQIFPFLSVVMAAGSIIIINELSTHFSSKMAELEQACYFNLSQLWLMRMALFGAFDIVMAAIIAVFRAGAYGCGWFPFLIYVLTPFFVTNAVLFSVFTVGRNAGRLVKYMAAAGFAGAAFAFQSSLSQIYEAIWLPVWMVVLAGAAWLGAVEILHMYRGIEGRGDQICWN